MSVETVDESELDESEFEFSLEDITESLKEPVQVLTFDNPSNPDKPFKFAMRQIQSDEYGKVFGSVFDGEVLKGALTESVQNGKGVNADAAIDALIENISESDDFQERNRQQRIAAIYLCMLLPKKKTKSGIAALPENIQTALFDACTKERNREWTFRP